MVYLMNWLRFSRLEAIAVPPSQVTPGFNGLKKRDIVKFVLYKSCCWFNTYSLIWVNMLQVGPVKYMEVNNTCKPNLWAGLADEVPAWMMEKWNHMSVGCTLQWLDHCLSLSTVCHITSLYSFRAFYLAWLCNKPTWNWFRSWPILVILKPIDVIHGLGRAGYGVSGCCGWRKQCWVANTFCSASGNSQCSR